MPRATATRDATSKTPHKHVVSIVIPRQKVKQVQAGLLRSVVLNVLGGGTYCSRIVSPRKMATREGEYVAPRMLLSVDEFLSK